MSTQRATGNRKRLALQNYFAESKDPFNSIVLVVPLFVLYQIGILFTDGWRNGADFVTGWIFQATGSRLAYFALNMVVLVAAVGLFFYQKQRKALRPTTFGLVFAESTIYAIFVGQVVLRVLIAIGLQPPGLSMVAAASNSRMGVFDNIVLSIGAGTYEELVFRLFMLGGMYWGLTKAKLDRMKAGVIAIIVSSLIFSAFHYQPIGMDPWELWSFSFRFLMGILFAVLYWTRGFAVAVYTHAIYDIIVLVLI